MVAEVERDLRHEIFRLNPGNERSGKQRPVQGHESAEKPKLAHQRFKFARSLRKLSGLSGLPHGLIEARGKTLEIVAIDRVVRQLLGCTVNGTKGHLFPRTIHDLLPVQLRHSHNRFLEKAFEAGSLPSSLMHPMRNMPLLRSDGLVIRVDICVGVITKVFRVPFASCAPLPRSTATRG